LPGLRELGVTLLEVMPVAEFLGRFNWDYDGVVLFGPYHGYGDPEAFKRFVDAAHRVGSGVILDVVYSHFGPDGCYLREFSADYGSASTSTAGFDRHFIKPVDTEALLRAIASGE
jgi:maltooligosyltrehalose trehalohydrolase